MAVLDAQYATVYVNGIKINNINSFDGFDGEAEDIDITNLDSTAMEYRQGLREFGNFSMEIQRDPADPGQIELYDMNADQRTEQFVLTLDSGDIATFNGYVKSITASGGVNAVVMGSVNIKITGAVVWS